jgi:RNA polymerase sigma-70 factor (sigma-E family)
VKQPDQGVDDEAAFAQFAIGARLRLARTAWLLTGSSSEAEDLVQEALVQTFVAWRRAKVDDPMAYARRVLVNRHIDRWRRARRELAAWTRHGVEPDGAAEAGSGAADDRDVLVRLLQGLSRRERAIVVLRYYFDLPEQQVAHELGVSVGTVKSTASRALKRLRQEWPGDSGQLGADLAVGSALHGETVEARNGVSGR